MSVRGEADGYRYGKLQSAILNRHELTFPQIVPERSACIDGFRVKTASIPKDHSEMCKYSDRKDIGYQRTSDYILDLLDKAKDAQTSSMSLGPIGSGCSGQSFPQAIEAKRGIPLGEILSLESKIQGFQESSR